MRRDFSEASKQKLIALVAQVENEKWCDFTDWMGDRWYDFESWIGTLDIKHYINDVNSYHKKVIDKNNTSKNDIEKIFAAVYNVDSSYTVRLASCKTQLEQVSTLITSLSGVINPAHGCFNTNDINTSLADVFQKYDDSILILQKLSEDGLTEEDFDNIDLDLANELLNRVVTSVASVLPNIKVGEEIEVPIGPGLSVYYSVTAKTDTDLPVEIDAIVEGQKEDILKITLSPEVGDDIKIGAELDSEGEENISIGCGGTDVTLNIDGSLETSASMTVGDSTYEVKVAVSTQEFNFEESVTTKIDGGEVTSTIGIKKTNVNNWVSVPVPVYEPAPVSMPQISVPEIDWGTVIIVTSAVCVVAGLVLAVPTGGGSLVLCFA